MIKQVIIPNETNLENFCANVVQILSENGFGTYSYSGSGVIITFTYESGDGIFGDKSPLQLYWASSYSNNPYVLTYDRERQFAIICRQNYVNVEIETISTYGKIVWYNAGELKVINGASNKRFYEAHNVCLNSIYNISSNEMQLVPFFYYLTHIDDLFLSMYNYSSSGTVVTDGVNRLLCCGGIIFLKI